MISFITAFTSFFHWYTLQRNAGILCPKSPIGLRAANDLLLSKSDEEIDIKSILERNEIPHAYKTETKPRQWRIPHSNEKTFKEKRSEFLKNQPKVSSEITNNKSASFNYKHLIIISVACYFLYSLFTNNSTKDNSSTSSSEAEYYINTEAFATYNKSDFDDMYNCIVQNDTKALRQMLDFGIIAVLQKGTEVFLVDVSFGYNVIREKGSTQKLWIASERISKH